MATLPKLMPRINDKGLNKQQGLVAATISIAKVDKQTKKGAFRSEYYIVFTKKKRLDRKTKVLSIRLDYTAQ